MVVEDSKGQRIHLQVPRGLYRRWRVYLKEFQMYNMTNVVVVDPRMRNKLKTIPCPWTVAELLDDQVVLPNHTFDFIGEVVGKANPRDVVTHTGRETKRMVIVLQDTKEQRINCNLFGNMVDDIAHKLTIRVVRDEGRIDSVYPFIKIVDDEEFIKNYKPPNNNVTESADAGQPSNLSFETQGNVVNLISDSDPHYSVDTLDESVSTVDGKTPAKRASPAVGSASPLLSQAEDFGDLSTNRGKRNRLKKQRFPLLEDDN
ncbi:hypothetical protein PIB30_096061 [Stylosanthes scabra]|uniref:DUF223 domain-containing protein n=1 Tax=Stylosanthes scabra TaxID=79078 RepID=A0ABU6SW79_9FABA|nr:hypothetical protein [Stylosanthes scabra]